MFSKAPGVAKKWAEKYGTFDAQGKSYGPGGKPGPDHKRKGSLSKKAASLGAKNFGQSKDKLTPGDSYDTSKYKSSHARKKAKRRYRAKG